MTDVKGLIRDFCDDAGYDFYDDYSGRFMYGRKCPGIVCDNPLDAVLGLSDWIHDCAFATGRNPSAADLLGSPKWDNMGLDMIVYFPALSD